MAIATDDFNRASLGSNWTNALRSLAINSNRVTGGQAGDCNGFFNAHTFAPSQYAQGVVIMGSDWGGIAVRATSNNFYSFYATSDQWELLKCVSGGFTVMANGSRAFATNDVLRLEVEGTTLRAYHNGALVTSFNDSSLSSGSPGVSFYSADATYNTFLDDWEGGDLHNELIGRDTRYLVNHPIYRR